MGTPSADLARRVVAPVVLCLLLLLAGSGTARAQDERFEFWPEVDLWVRASPQWTLFFPLALSRAREVDYTEALVGAHVDRRFNRHLSARVGYRYLWSPSERDDSTQYSEHRPVAEVTVRAYPGAGITLLDRNRFDYRIINGETSWRYRNRVRGERPFELGDERAVTPYAMVELGYDSRYDDVTRVRLQVGAEYQFDHSVWLDLYFIRQWDDATELSRVNAIGVALNLAWCTWCRSTAPPPRVENGVN